MTQVICGQNDSLVLAFPPKKFYYCKLQLKVVELHFTFITRRQLKDPDVEM